MPCPLGLRTGYGGTMKWRYLMDDDLGKECWQCGEPADEFCIECGSPLCPHCFDFDEGRCRDCAAEAKGMGEVTDG